MTTDTQQEIFENQADAVAAEDTKDTTRVYEVGYHIVPTASEGDVQKQVTELTNLLKKHNVDFVGERTPALIELAYTIEKVIGGAKQHFDTAYFGWIAFEASPTVIAAVEEALRTNDEVLRHIIIKTTRETVAATMADPGLDVGAPKPDVPEEGEDGEVAVEGTDTDAMEEKETE